MVVVLKMAIKWAIATAEKLLIYCDPRTAHLPLMASPLPVMAILALYLFFVFLLGPWLMKDRQPFELRRVMVVYNALQVVGCGYIFYESIRLGWGWKLSYTCEPLSMKMETYDFEVAYTVWLYFILKLVDLSDTVFMVLRKNFHQISFLHLYHHTVMVMAIYAGTRTVPGGHHTFLGATNCFVHCLLYGYYLVSLFNTNIKSAWWKKYITVAQIVQFGLNGVHEGIVLLTPSCEVNKQVSGLLVVQNIFMFALFTDFYLKNYSKKASEKRKAQKES